MTHLFLSIGLFNQYANTLTEVFAQLKYLITGGDVIEPNTVRRVLQQCPPKNFLSAYGPTETTTFATTCRLNGKVDEETQIIPIGQPIASIYILDEAGSPVPVGVAGEIHIGGDGVAQGYLNRPELTEEKFIPDPFSAKEGARMYRTGDLGRWRADGVIEFVGRNDFQVKIRGFRVELGEIEARLAELPAVREVLVLAREDQPGDKRLGAYWTTPAGMAEAEVPTPEQLRDHLKAELPAYMVPAAFVRLEAMPLTPNGKVDRKALPEPEASARIGSVYEPPKGKTEAALAEIWKTLLKVDKVGRNDEFFDLGGHSLMIMQLVSRVHATFGVIVSVRNIYEQASLKSMAVFIVKERVRKLDPVAYESMFGSDAIH